MTANDVQQLLPLIIVAAIAILMMLLVAIKRNHVAAATITMLGFAIAFLTLMITPGPDSPPWLFSVDHFAKFYMGLIFLAAILLILISYGYFKKQECHKEEYYLLLSLAALGSSVLVISRHFVTLFLGLEILSISLYTMISYLRERVTALEAGIKYLILAAVSSAFLLFGLALLYAGTGTMTFAMLTTKITTGEVSGLWIIAGLALFLVGAGFKLAIVPFHFWTPDVYQGAPAPVTAFIATISKGGMVALLLRFFQESNAYQFNGLLQVLGVIAILSMFFGNLLALLQNNVKRILAYSSIAHLGYILVAFVASGSLAAEAVSFYLVAYFITTIGAFGIIALLSDENREPENLDDYQGLFWRRPWVASILTAMLFSLAGIPLTAGFVGKFYIIAAGVGSSLWLLVIILVINSAIGLYYYLRIIVKMYSRAEEMAGQKALPSVSFLGGLTLAILSLLLIWFGVYPQGLMTIIRTMIAGLGG